MSVATIGAKVKAWRERRGYSQSDVARAVGKTRSWATKLEHGAFARVRYEDVVKLAGVMGITPAELAADSGAGVPVGVRPVALPLPGPVVGIVGAADASDLTDHDRQVEEVVDLVGGARRPAGFAMVGDCLIEEHIRHGDYLIVDKANRLPLEGEIVVARVNGTLTAKIFHRDEATGAIELRPAGPGLPVIAIGPEDELEIVGVYTAMVRTKRRK